MTAERLSTYTRCKSCRRLQLWTVTLAGKRVPLEPSPHPDGVVVVQHLPDGTVRGRFLSGLELPAQQEAYRPHDRVCPAIERRHGTAGGPRCGVCREPLDEWLVDQGYTRHIGCLTPPAPDLRAARTAAVAEPEPPAAPAHEQGDLFDLGGAS